jgi:hypothetical protein
MDTTEHEFEAQGGEESLHARMAREHGLDEAACIELLAWLDEQSGQRRAGLDELRKLNERFRTAIQCLVAYQQKQARDQELWLKSDELAGLNLNRSARIILDKRAQALARLMMSTRVLAMALGFNHAAGANSMAELGRKLRVGKATVNKCLNQMLERMGMEDLPGQRDEAARQRMAEARERQLKRGVRNETRF